MGYCRLLLCCSIKHKSSKAKHKSEIWEVTHTQDIHSQHWRHSFPHGGHGGERELLLSPSSGTSPRTAPGAGRELANETQSGNCLHESQAEPCLLTHDFRVLSRLHSTHMNYRDRRCECIQSPVLSWSREDHANNLCKPWCHRGFDGNFKCCTFFQGWPQGSPHVSVHARAAPPIKLPPVRRMSSDIVSSRFSGSSHSAQPIWFAAALGYIWEVAIQVSGFLGGSGGVEWLSSTDVFQESCSLTVNILSALAACNCIY